MKLKFVVVFEQGPDNYSAYVPDLPGCISTGKTWKKMLAMIQEAIEFHVEGMLEDGESLPEKRMSMEEAMAHHAEPLSEEELVRLSEWDFPPTLSTTFKEIEVEIDMAAQVQAASTVSRGA